MKTESSFSREERFYQFIHCIFLTLAGVALISGLIMAVIRGSILMGVLIAAIGVCIAGLIVALIGYVGMLWVIED